MLVGDTGYVCSPQDPQALATSVISCVETDRRSLGLKARRRIEENWSIGRLSQSTERLLLLALAEEHNQSSIELSATPIETDRDALKFNVE